MKSTTRGAAAALLVAVYALTACTSEAPTPTASGPDVASTERSEASYCKTFYEEGEQFRRTYQNIDPDSDPVAAAIVLLGAPQEAALFFGKLRKVAPDQIEPDVAVMQSTLQRVSDNLGKNATDPIAAMIEAIAVSASTKGSEERINAFTLANCGPPPSPNPQPSVDVSTARAKAPVEPGEALLSIVADGYAALAMDSDVLAMMASIDGALGIRTYDLTGNQLAANSDPSSFEPDCKLAIAKRFTGDDLVFSVKVERMEAQGVEGAHETQTLIASDARTLAPVWTLGLGRDEAVQYCSPGATDGNTLRSNLTFTPDGHWALLTLNSKARVIDLATGKAYDVPGVMRSSEDVSVAGNYILIDNAGDFDDGKLDLLDPVSAKVIGSTSTLSVLRSRYFPVSSSRLLSTLGLNGNEGTGVTQLLSLPSLKPIWAIPTPSVLDEAEVFVDAASGTLVLGGSSIVALSPETGAQVWQLRIEGSSICAVAGGKVMVAVNNQVAYLDARTGKQLAFDSTKNDCPGRPLNDHFVVIEGDGGSWTVTRVL